MRRVVIHLVRYGRNADPSGWLAGEPGPPQSEDMTPPLWDAALLRETVAMLRREGIEVAAIENLPPALWSDILLDGPRRDAQMQDLQQLVRDMGEAGIPVLGYNFSLAGVWGWQRRPVGRGGAMATTFDLDRFDHDRPIPRRRGLEHPGPRGSRWAGGDLFRRGPVAAAGMVPQGTGAGGGRGGCRAGRGTPTIRRSSGFAARPDWSTAMPSTTGC